jgi:hypothetical protein
MNIDFNLLSSGFKEDDFNDLINQNMQQGGRFSGNGRSDNRSNPFAPQGSYPPAPPPGAPNFSPYPSYATYPAYSMMPGGMPGGGPYSSTTHTQPHPTGVSIENYNELRAQYKARGVEIRELKKDQESLRAVLNEAEENLIPLHAELKREKERSEYLREALEQFQPLRPAQVALKGTGDHHVLNTAAQKIQTARETGDGTKFTIVVPPGRLDDASGDIVASINLPD